MQMSRHNWRFLTNISQSRKNVQHEEIVSLLWKAKRKSYVISQTVGLSFPMTLSDLNTPNHSTVHHLLSLERVKLKA